MHTIPVFLYSVLCVLFALYLFVIIMRIFALLRLSRFFGKYAHITPANEQPDDVTFTISYGWNNFLSPVPGITIKIRRSSAKDYFKGRYELENPVPGEAYGWHHLYLFDKPDTRIIMNLFHLKDNKQLISNEGYYIVKK